MLENTKINSVDFTGIPVKERIYEWNMFGSVGWYKNCEVVGVISSPMVEQSSYGYGESVSICEEEEGVYNEEETEWASMSEEGQLASSQEEEYSYKPGLFVGPYKRDHNGPSEEGTCQPFDRKESRKAKFIEQRPTHNKHKRHSSIKARYLVDQEILKEIKLVHKYLELDRQDSILKANRLRVYKESKENLENTNVERFVENIFLHSSKEHLTGKPKSSKSKAGKEEVSDIPEYRHIKAVETVRKKKGFFCKIFGCLTL